MNLIVFGDSITQGCWDVEGGWPVRIKKEINSKQITSAEPFKDYNMSYIRAVSGDTSRDLRKRIREDFEPISLSSHTTVVIQIGVNDSIMEENGNRVSRSEFKENIEEIIKVCEEEADQIVFLGLTPVKEEKVDPLPDEPGCSFLNDQIEDYELILKDITEEKDVNFIPLFDHLNSHEWREEMLWDGVHPNSRGHEKIFTLVRDEIMEKVQLDLSS